MAQASYNSYITQCATSVPPCSVTHYQHLQYTQVKTCNLLSYDTYMYLHAVVRIEQELMQDLAL